MKRKNISNNDVLDSIIISGDAMPDFDNVSSLGSGSKRFKNATFSGSVTAENISVDTITTTSNSADSIILGSTRSSTTPAADLHIQTTGSNEIWLEADSDNVTETDVPTIRMTQDGGAIMTTIGLVDNSGTNDFEIKNYAASGAGGIGFYTAGTVTAPVRSGTKPAITGNPTRRLYVQSDGQVRVDGRLAINAGANTVTTDIECKTNSSTTDFRKICLYTSGANLYLFAGFGTESNGTLRINITNSSAACKWYRGDSNSASTEIMRLTGGGQLQLLTNNASTSTSAGSLVCSGGMGVSGNTYISGTLYVTSTSNQAKLGNITLNASAGGSRVVTIPDPYQSASLLSNSIVCGLTNVSARPALSAGNEPETHYSSIIVFIHC